MSICNDEPKSLIPVCDNMNQTHRSPCSLAVFSCKRINLHHNHARILVHVGPCNIQSPIFTFEEEVILFHSSLSNIFIIFFEKKIQ